jgi:hypothetical protein
MIKGDKIVNLDAKKFRKYLLTEFESDLSPDEIENVLTSADIFKTDEAAVVIITGLSLGVPEEKIMEFFNPEFVKFVTKELHGI